MLRLRGPGHRHNQADVWLWSVAAALPLPLLPDLTSQGSSSPCSRSGCDGEPELQICIGERSGAARTCLLQLARQSVRQTASARPKEPSAGLAIRVGSIYIVLHVEPQRWDSTIFTRVHCRA